MRILKLFGTSGNAVSKPVQAVRANISLASVSDAKHPPKVLNEISDPFNLQSPQFLQKIFTSLNIREKIVNRLMLKPSKEEYSHPSKSGLEYKDVFISTLDGESLHGYYLPSPETAPADKIMIFFHGYDKNVTSWFPACANIQRHVPINALIMDYRGYGKSTGTPSTKGLITDALATYNYLIENGFKGENISLYGQSLGSAVALELASRVKVRSLVVQSSYHSFKNLISYHHPFIPSFLIKNDLFNPTQLIKKINVPILIGHGAEDKISPVANGKLLYSLANEPKKLIVLERAGHGHLTKYLTEEYFESIKKLFL